MSAIEAYPVLYDSQITTTSAEARYQPGQLFVHRSQTGRGYTALVQYVQLNNDGCSQGEALVTNFATLAQYSVKKSATTDADTGFDFRGLAAATIASQYFGFAIMQGYVEKADLSLTAASGDILGISASTAGKLSGFAHRRGYAIARTAIATGVGSVSLLGLWG